MIRVYYSYDRDTVFELNLGFPSLALYTKQTPNMCRLLDTDNDLSLA